MPPNLGLTSSIRSVASRPSTATSLLASFAKLQIRNASILNTLSNTPGSYSKRIRRGRGPSSGKGKTSGRGHKGQKQHGKVPKGFQGGQTPEEVAHGKLGFKNVHSVDMSPINLSRIQHWIDQGRLDPSRPITLKELTSSRAIHGIKDGVKLLCDRGQTTATPLKQPIHVVVSKASIGAIATVEALGGTVTTRYYTPLAIRKIRAGEMHPYISLRWDATQPSLSGDILTPDGIGATAEDRVTGMGFQYRLPDPTSRKDIEYYREAKTRGYLSHTVKEGESASLFFKPPISEEEIKQRQKNKGASAAGAEARRKEQNRMW